MTADMVAKSPFPGMDPWLEKQWRDFHQRLVLYTCDQIQPQLPPDLRARTEERTYLETMTDEKPRAVYPDVRVVEHPRPSASKTAIAGGAAVATPLIIEYPDEPVTEGYIEIVETGSGHRVITVIEVLSPGNKHGGEGEKLYLKKQDEVLGSATNLVEIDLLRGGNHIIAAPIAYIPPSHRTPYRICIHRGTRPLAAEIYAVPLRQRLPAIPIPLRSGEHDVALDLQEVFEKAYVNGRYEQTDYAVPLNPPLDPADATWAEDILREKGLIKSA
jgi:hypothetical protein